MEDNLIREATELFQRLSDMDDECRIDIINAIRKALHQYSPMKREPVDCVLSVRNENVHANEPLAKRLTNSV